MVMVSGDKVELAVKQTVRGRALVPATPALEADVDDPAEEDEDDGEQDADDDADRPGAGFPALSRRRDGDDVVGVGAGPRHVLVGIEGLAVEVAALDGRVE